MPDANEKYASTLTPEEHAMCQGSHAASLDRAFDQTDPAKWTLLAISTVNELVHEGARSHIAASWVEAAIARVTEMQERARVDAEGKRPRR